MTQGHTGLPDSTAATTMQRRDDAATTMVMGYWALRQVSGAITPPQKVYLVNGSIHDT